MIRILYRREKCIGCCTCAEVYYKRWRMSGRDGKANLIGSKEKGGYFRISVDDDEWDEAVKAAEGCPVKIIILNKK